MAELTQPARQRRARRGRGLVALARARLRRTRGGRAAFALGALLLVGSAAVALLLRVTDGEGAHLEGIVAAAARFAPWLTGAPIALAAAADRRALDRRDGIDALAAARGFSTRSLETARLLGAMIEAALVIAVPLCALALLTAAVAGSPARALDCIGLTLGALGFAAVAGVTLGGIGAACSAIGRSRGGLLFVAIIAGPWILAGLAGRPSLSIPGALAAALSFALGGAGA